MNLEPNVLIYLNRGSKAEDEESIEELFSFMKENIELNRGGARLMYEGSPEEQMPQMNY